YFLILYYSFQKVHMLEIIFAQILAKFSMLILLTTSKPAWEGLGAYMMQFARKRDLLIGSIPLILILFNPLFIIPTLLAISITVAVRIYAERIFGGMSGDVIGACNCISFSAVLLFFSLETDISLFFLGI
ncbi:MAG: adenosylcobinamide-GDP ribazoletransferase, partial [Archaeoglobaceae archaeon]